MEHLAYMDDEAVALWKIWGQTDADRAAIEEYFQDAARTTAGQRVARRIESTDTIPERPLADTWLHRTHAEAA